MKIIVDFDNTLGVNERDVDDFIALLYLMKAKADIVLVTTTFGNDTIDIVNEKTKMVFNDLDLNYNLAFGNEDAGERIVETINTYPNDITILTLGSTTNLARALEIDPSIKHKAKMLSMGIITEKLLINNKVMDELNFSVDHKASIKVLTEMEDITILTANNCLDFYVTLREIDDIFEKETYLRSKSRAWFDFHSKDYDIDYIIIWDLVAAVYFTNPELFIDDKRKMSFVNPKMGLIKEDENGKIINMPKIKDRCLYIDTVRKVFKDN